MNPAGRARLTSIFRSGKATFEVEDDNEHEDDHD
jgi:hypothetical protein